VISNNNKSIKPSRVFRSDGLFYGKKGISEYLNVWVFA